MKLTSNYNFSRVSTFVNDTVRINNQSDSSYGAGWNLDGVTKLDRQPNGDVLLIEGDGTLWEFSQPTIDFDLNNWRQEEALKNGLWVLSADGSSVTQTRNVPPGELISVPTFYVAPDDVINNLLTVNDS